MDGKQRAEMIRQGNALFNERRIKEAVSLFVKAEYKDGLARVGDYFFHDQGAPLKALPFYQKAKYQSGLQQIYQKMALVISKLIYSDEVEQDWDDYLMDETELLDQQIKEQKKDQRQQRQEHARSEINVDEQTRAQLDQGGFTSMDFSTQPLSQGKITELENLRQKLQEKGTTT